VRAREWNGNDRIGSTKARTRRLVNFHQGRSSAMKLFGGKDSARPSGRGDARDSNGEPQASHRLTLELKRAETFATMLARSRASQAIEVADLLAGMYICNWDRISHYWDESRHDEVEDLLRRICQISPQRWHSWIEHYDHQHREEENPSWHLFGFLKRQKTAEKPLRPSAALATALKQAEQIAPSYDRTADRSIPILTTECVLLSIVRNLGSEVSRKLLATGLDVARLEKDVLLPRRPPRA